METSVSGKVEEKTSVSPNSHSNYSIERILGTSARHNSVTTGNADRTTLGEFNPVSQTCISFFISLLKIFLLSWLIICFHAHSTEIIFWSCFCLSVSFLVREEIWEQGAVYSPRYYIPRLLTIM